MAELFSVSRQQLAQDSRRKDVLFLAVSILLAGAWVAWAHFDRIAQYATTDRARLEVSHMYLVQSPASGRVSASYLELGKAVETGTPLIELDTNSAKLKVQEQHTRQDAFKNQLKTLRLQLDAQQHTQVEERAASESSIDQARAHVKETQAAVQLSEEETRQNRLLAQQGLIAQIELTRSESTVKQKSSQLEGLEKAVNQAEREQSMKQSERQANIESIRNAIRQIEGELAGSGNTVEQIENDLRRQSVLAPDKGRLGSIMSLKPGAYVREGDTIAAIISEGRLRIVAEYEPNAAIGRVRPGQIGRLHLDGFPWTEYGSVTGSVISVGNEVRDGRVRVELDPAPNSRIPLQHGLPGTLEIAMERISPAAFLLQTAGGYLTRPANPSTAPADPGAPAKAK